jgi:hypothetical protein
MGEKNAYRILVGKPEGKRPRRRWVTNNKIEDRVVWTGLIWIRIGTNRDKWRALVNTVMDLRAPYNTGKFLSGCTNGGFSRKAQLHEVS